MKRGIFGIGILALLLVLALLVGTGVSRALAPVCRQFALAREGALEENWDQAREALEMGEALWDRQRWWLWTLADEAYLEDIEVLLTQAQVLLQRKEAADLASLCAELEKRTENVGKAQW